ncbi:hypothetical protein HPP92_000100 [Vanilla planifolia]|uniref:DUF632 domain-containing protein n=1 Tax=Vanilla planifolia TaxID=51239 RepID=A0A835RPD1_VANPL|nr:hypothetical protein HPP92_000100 [Vanilla planifolia]
MKSAPTMPSTVYHDPYGEQWSKSQGQAPQSGYGSWYGYPPFAQEGAYYNEPLRPSQREEGHVSADCEEERLPPPPPAPPPPPPSQNSPWDFFNPFDSYEQMLDGYTKSRFVLGSVASSPNSSEVREREGIPDLEEETEQESVKGTGKRTILEDKRVVDDDSERFNSSVGSSEAVIAPHGEKRSAAVLEDLEETKRSRGGVSSIDSCEVEDSDVREEPLRCEGKVTTSRTMEAGERTKDAALSIHRTKDVVEAMKEITEQFKSAACCGEDVSRMLEVDKLKYRPKIRIFKGAKMLKMNEAARIDFEKYVNMQSSNLSSTLEQLYLWEKKLYKEVKDEEKLRVFYDKEYARLKTLDDKGAESNKIDSSRAAINKFINKISMSIKSVDAISRRIHKLRDEELQPQLLELIHGLIRMWRSMLDCHQKQFQAIIEAKSHQFMLKPFAQQSLIAKATLELELELMNWFSCFSNWVKAQRAYVESLNGWLIKWLHEKQEETPDGIAPLSPGRVGAPAIFVFSNDWQHTMERISEDDVLKAMHDFTANLHRLCESQGEEQQQKLRAEYLSKDFGRRLKALQKQSSGNGFPNAIASDKLVLPVNGISTVSNGNKMHLDLMRRRIDAARAKHDDFAKQMQEVVSNSLRTGLIPIFESLENYSSETLKGYDELRLPCT